MQTISVTHVDVATVDAARDAAVAAISDQIACPVVLSWRDRKTDAFAPSIPGGDPHERWRDYGASMGGTHEVEVGGGSISSSATPTDSLNRSRNWST